MRLYLVRHGIAVDSLSSEIKVDFDRPLTAEGREECAQVASGLRRLGVRPQLLMSSPLVRARQTAEVFALRLKVESDIVICQALSPGGSIKEIYTRAAGGPEDVMFFGHEPDMMRLAQSLLACHPTLQIPFKKASVCRIDVDKLPPSGEGVLKWFITPKIAKQLT